MMFNALKRNEKQMQEKKNPEIHIKLSTSLNTSENWKLKLTCHFIFLKLW